ncbi:MAG: hypothetical protein JXB47_12780 [Anaerolineae bacterium]|nr:hypothetical protein [Anaerolineae bacterium]
MKDFRYEELAVTDLNQLVEDGIEHEIVGGPTCHPSLDDFLYLVKVSTRQLGFDPHPFGKYDWEKDAAKEFEFEENYGERGPRGVLGPGPCPAGEYEQPGDDDPIEGRT